PPTAHGPRPPSPPPGAAAPTRPPSPARTSATVTPPATRPPEPAPSESAPPESASPESADTDSAHTAFAAAAFPGAPGRVTVRVAPIERVWDTDILVSSENVFLEMSKTFRPTVSGVLRRAAAERAAGEVVDDVLARELALWLHTHRRTGLAVPPGTVVPTSAGALSRQGVRRIYHAAVATPVDHGSRYHVAPGTVADAVRASFELGRAERRTLALPLTSICFPLLGAGHGGLPAADAATRLLAAIREELRRDPSWSVLLVTVHREYLEFLRDANSGS
ncbi:macro domain-containing protein, partial [Streptomyces olivaceus]|uniref:macro domain-containing protein n=1 Tax=Streptomyces olivaceus TaxID=47716 RepID=UPI004056C81A